MMALAPGDGRVNALARRVCASALSLAPLPAEVAVDRPECKAEPVVSEFAEQFGVDVSSIGDELRPRLASAFGTPSSCWCSGAQRIPYDQLNLWLIPQNAKRSQIFQYTLARHIRCARTTPLGY